MKAKRVWTGLAIALAVAVGLVLPEAASADRGSRGGGGRGGVVVKGGGFHGHGGRVFVGGSHHHHGSRIGIAVGVPLFWGSGWYPYYGYPSYYYGPYGYPAYGYPAYGYPGYGYYPPAVVQSSPPTYIEKGTPEGAPGGSDYWYYCEQSKAYYPYVKECPGGWRRETPRPPPAQ